MVLNALLTALSLGVVRAYGSFNAEELSSAIYDVDILGEPKLATEMVSFDLIASIDSCNNGTGGTLYCI